MLLSYICIRSHKALILTTKTTNMNKIIKMVLLVIGVVLVGYGVYTLIAPEASVSIGPLSMEAQDNTNSYITLAIGVVAIIGGAFASNKA